MRYFDPTTHNSTTARPEWLDKLSGSAELRAAFGNPASLDALLARWRAACAAYSAHERANAYSQRLEAKRDGSGNAAQSFSDRNSR